MKSLIGPVLLGAAVALAAPPSAAASPPEGSGGFQVPVDYSKLPNGLKVVLSHDGSSPKAVVAVYYNIGFRIEPKDRTGFAHLFEHMMFQGSQNLGKMEFIKLVQSTAAFSTARRASTSPTTSRSSRRTPWKRRSGPKRTG